MSACGKFKFCFLELSGIFFLNIFNPKSVESIEAEPMDTEGTLSFNRLWPSFITASSIISNYEGSVQFSHSVVLTLCNPIDCSMPGFPVQHLGLLKFMSIESVMPSSRLILCCPLLLPPSIFPSIRVFSNDSVLRIRWPKYWSFSFSISPSNEYSGLIFFRVDWLDLLAVQRTLKSILQHHNSNVHVNNQNNTFISVCCAPGFKAAQTEMLPFFIEQNMHVLLTPGGMKDAHSPLQ